MDRHYFQFPLCALSFGRDINERLRSIISLGCVQMGAKQWQKFTPNERQARGSVQPRPEFCKCTIDLGKEEELQAIAGCEYLNLCCLNVKGILADYARVARFIKDFERRHGTDTRVRIRKDWVFEVHDNKGMSYSELAVLAAIYSKIGASKRPVRITREEIWRRAHGYKSDRVFKLETRDHACCLTKRQVRSTIDRLHSRNFFARVTFARRETYYSHRLSSTALADQVFTTKIQRSVARQARRRADAALTERIQAERRKLAGPNATEGATDLPL
jgi:hypothetical protein